MEKAPKKLHIFLIYLALATFIAFEQVRHNDFVNYDDNAYVTQNSQVKAGITFDSVIRAFTTIHPSYNWHPLTSLSHMLDCQLFGLDAGWHHMTSLLFHIANTLLLFWILQKTTGRIWPSAFVAAVFALHPLHVESVAWVAERKNVLSGLFWMLTMLAYVRYAQRPGIRRYLLVALALSLGLLAKQTLVTLPCVLLLMDYWPLGRLQWGRQDTGRTLLYSESAGLTCKKTSPGRLIAEKIPLFILVVASCIFTVIVQQIKGAFTSLDRLPPGVRVNNALVSYVSYIGKMIWPTRLAILYPHPFPRLPAWKPIIALLIFVSISVGVIYMVRRRHDLAPLLVGWLWYLGTLIPVIGLVQVGKQSMADRYTYLPSIGILIMVAWGAARLSNGWRRRNMVFAISAGLLLVVLTLCTRAQVRHWKNSMALFGHAAEVTENNYVMHHYYGDALFKEGRLDGAAFHFQESLRINPRYKEPYNGLAKLFLEQGKIDEAIAVCTKRLRIGKPGAAIYHRLGQAYYRKGAYGPAVQSFKESLRLKPDSVSAHRNLTKALGRMDNPDEVITHLTEAIQLNPNIAPTHHALALALNSKGRTEEAITHFREALRIKPGWEKPMNSLAWVLATHNDPKFRNSQEALSLALRACELTDYQDPGFVDTLAAAYAAAGRFSDAVATAEKAVYLTASGDNKQRHKAIEDRLQLYKAGQPYRR
ncbi:MAG: tetratricopeptide repeat protein [Planctomycetota bacterium]|jgi:tetratricopeptide (TPR) repeat protein